MSLRDKYAYAISTAKGKFDGSAQERDGKLHFVGSVKTEEEKNEIWNAIKTIPEWRNDVVADIQVTGGGSSSGGAATATATTSKTYTVKAGDTLSKIAKQHLGDANAYMRIYELNRDQLSNPDLIKPGQVLKLP
ncbi:MAG: LysM peptidoglycan-binding domain-containing protein [Acidobacteria bacterium]|jgi:nucleoid-associated protein YgaU|nr:LysM peptidoglycan-binding domain-containing protein [Acidobacteriota bacterium]MBW8894864.1 LysM peptidoglycan-binding domain-containing protein [Acidobacteriota bacterium]